MACSPCAAKRARLAEQLKKGELLQAAKTAIEGAAEMAGLKEKEIQNVDDETSPGS